MQIIEIIYATAAVIAIGASVPQIRQLVISKASDEFSLSTWVIWLTTQVCTLLYVATLGKPLLIISSILWIAFYAAMVYLILYYRYRYRPLQAEQVVVDVGDLADNPQKA